MPRVLPPAASPLALGTIAAGALAAVGAGRPAARAAGALRAEGAGGIQLLASGTAALQTALATAAAQAAARGRAAPWVALPAYACFDLATAAVGAGVGVRLYDLDPAALAPRPGAVAALAADPDCAAIVIVHLYGVPVEATRVRAEMAGSRALLIEDAAQGAGGRLHGRLLGLHGDLGVFSFGRGKGITAGGGGALVGAAVDDGAAPHPGARGARAVVLTLVQHLLGRPALYALPASLPFLALGDTVYKAPGPIEGMTRASAAMLPAALALATPTARRRGEIVARLAPAVAAAGGLVPTPPADAVPGWLRLPVVLPSPLPPEAWPAARRLGIMPGYPQSLATLPPLQPLRRDGDAPMPGAEALVQRLVTLPCHHLLADRDLDRLREWLGGLPAGPGDAPTHRL